MPVTCHYRIQVTQLLSLTEQYSSIQTGGIVNLWDTGNYDCNPQAISSV